MSDSPAETPRTNVVTAIIQRDDTSVLVVRDGRRWSLPRVETRGHWYAEVAPFNAEVADRYGLSATVLRTLAHRLDEETNTSHLVTVFEAHGARARTLRDARWASVGDALAAADADARGVLAEWFDQAAFDRARPLRRDWSRAGWLDGTLAWCRDQLARHGIALAGEPQQVKHWSIASIWRMPTGGGDVWLKAVPPFFAHEGALLQLIAPSMPEHLPRVIATDRERGLLLMHPLPGDDLRTRQDAWRSGTMSAANDRAVRLLARLQQEWSARIDDLLAAGAVDRRLHALNGALEAVLARDAVRARFTDDEVRRLRAFGETVPAQIEALRDCGVPETLMHGDFYPGNIASEDDGRLVIFDWTDGCVSHPFFDLATFLPRDPVEHAAGTLAMIEAWSPVVDPARLERAAELAQPLACIHHATSYMRLLDGICPTEHWEFASDVLFWLRWLRAIIE